MTDNEIIKAWEKVLATGDAPIGERFSCWITTKLAKETFDMLKNQKAENERLLQKLQQAQSEAYREFAERLCKDRVSNDPVVIAVKVELKEHTEKKDLEE